MVRNKLMVINAGSSSLKFKLFQARVAALGGRKWRLGCMAGSQQRLHRMAAGDSCLQL
jgi:acetate kinase